MCSVSVEERRLAVVGCTSGVTVVLDMLMQTPGCPYEIHLTSNTSVNTLSGKCTQVVPETVMYNVFFYYNNMAVIGQDRFYIWSHFIHIIIL